MKTMGDDEEPCHRISRGITLEATLCRIPLEDIGSLGIIAVDWITEVIAGLINMGSLETGVNSSRLDVLPNRASTGHTSLTFSKPHLASCAVPPHPLEVALIRADAMDEEAHFRISVDPIGTIDPIPIPLIVDSDVRAFGREFWTRGESGRRRRRRRRSLWSWSSCGERIWSRLLGRNGGGSHSRRRRRIDEGAACIRRIRRAVG